MYNKIDENEILKSPAYWAYVLGCFAIGTYLMRLTRREIQKQKQINEDLEIRLEEIRKHRDSLIKN